MSSLFIWLFSLTSSQLNHYAVDRSIDGPPESQSGSKSVGRFVGQSVNESVRLTVNSQTVRKTVSWTDNVVLSTGLIMWIGHRKEIWKLKFGSVSPSLWRRANASNVSFQTSLWWPLHIINPVDKTTLFCNTPHRPNTTISWETYFLYSDGQTVGSWVGGSVSLSALWTIVWLVSQSFDRWNFCCLTLKADNTAQSFLWKYLLPDQTRLTLTQRF